MTHMPEPCWGPFRGGDDAEPGATWELVADMSESDIRRVIACVHACEGIDTAFLELQGHGQFLSAARRIADDIYEGEQRRSASLARHRHTATESAERLAKFVKDGPFGLPPTAVIDFSEVIEVIDMLDLVTGHPPRWSRHASADGMSPQPEREPLA